LRKCIIALKMADHLPDFKEADYIGADRGALFLAGKKIRMKLAIGDFDSVSDHEKEMIAQYSDQVISLNPVKDNSDSEAAVDEAVRRGYEKIYIVGATGGRIDHEIVNIRLCWKYPEQVILIDGQNLCRALKKGVHRIEKKGYRYVSVFAESECEISLKGFRYPLDHRVLDETDLYGLSNELLEEKGIIEVHRGTILCVQTGD